MKKKEKIQTKSLFDSDDFHFENENNDMIDCLVSKLKKVDLADGRLNKSTKNLVDSGTSHLVSSVLSDFITFSEMVDF